MSANYQNPYHNFEETKKRKQDHGGLPQSHELKK